MAASGNGSEIYYWGDKPDSPWSFGFAISDFPTTKYNIEDVAAGYFRITKDAEYTGPIVSTFNFDEKDEYELNIRVHRESRPKLGEILFSFKGPSLKMREDVTLSERLKGDRTKRSLLNYVNRVILTTAAGRDHIFLRGSALYSESDDRLCFLFGDRHSGKTATTLESIRKTNQRYELVANSWIHIWLPQYTNTPGLDSILDRDERELPLSREDKDFGVVFPQMYPEETCPVRIDKINNSFHQA